MLGVNELGWNGTDTFRNQSAKLIERLQADHPETQIVLSPFCRSAPGKKKKAPM